MGEVGGRGETYTYTLKADLHRCTAGDNAAL